jgi:prepilin-type processing-associated H-X9-DG protein
MTKFAARYRAFTLIEMLVVAGLILLLAGIALPVISRVRENGHATFCSNNMKQLGIAFQQYLQDNNSRFPGGAQFQKWADGGHWVTGGVGGVPTNWTDKGLAEHAPGSDFDYQSPKEAYPEQGVLYPYVKNASTYVCPSMRDRQKRLSYSMNCALGGMSDVRVKTPSEIILLVDEGRTLNDGYFWAVNNASSTDSLTSVHNGGGNILFVDGHVKHFQFDALPIDWNPAGLAIKSAKTGTVRFHDASFGPNGSYQAPGASTNSCSE